MAKFLTFETNAIKINRSIFPSSSASFGVQANTNSVFDIDGNFIRYAATSPIQGKFSTSFYLTGAFPDYLKIENQSDTPVSISFNNFYIPSAFLSELSFDVKPFQPILVNTSFDFFHGLKSLSTESNNTHTEFGNLIGNLGGKTNLATLNGLGSYILTSNRSTYRENPSDFIVSDFNYSFTVEREPIVRISQSVPSRVALKQINAQMSVASNNLDGMLRVNGNTAKFDAVLKDSQNPSISTNVSLDGNIIDQGYQISDSSYGVANIKMTKTINKKRTVFSIPFEVEDYLLKSTLNTVDVIIPTLKTETIKKEEQTYYSAPENPVIYVAPKVSPPVIPEFEAKDYVYIKTYVRFDYTPAIPKPNTYSVPASKNGLKNIASGGFYNHKVASFGNSKGTLNFIYSNPKFSFIDLDDQNIPNPPFYYVGLYILDKNLFLNLSSLDTTGLPVVSSNDPEHTNSYAFVIKIREYKDDNELTLKGTYESPDNKVYASWDTVKTKLMGASGGDGDGTNSHPYNIYFPIGTN